MTGAGRDAPFVSVVIPTFRRPELLRVAIDSVLAQTFRDFEVLVVDDDRHGSARATVAAVQDERVTYLAHDGARGGSGARNVGIFRSRGAWIAFLDDDDAWLPEKLAAQRRAVADGGPDLGLVYSGYDVYDFERARVVSTRRPSKKGWIGDDLLYRNEIGGLFSVLVRADLARAIGGFDERFPALQDAEFYVRVAQRAEVTFVDASLVRVRKDHGARITANPQRRLVGTQLFWAKFRPHIAKRGRLSHRAASRVLLAAAAAGNGRALLGAVPWFLAGLVFDPRNVLDTTRSLASMAWRRARDASGGGAEDRA